MIRTEPEPSGSVSSDRPPERATRRKLGPLRLAGALLLVGFVALVAVQQWEAVQETFGRLSLLELLVAELLVLAGLGASILTWRSALAQLGSQLSLPTSSKIYLVGQLAKYLPGSFWVLPAQMELAFVAGVPRMRALTTSFLAMAVNVLTGLAAGLLVVPSVVSGEALRIFALVAMLVLGASALTPPVLTRLMNFVLRLARRAPFEGAVSWRGMLATASWSVVSRICYGLSLWVIAVAAGAPGLESLPLCIAGMALAMVIGFLVFFVPSGTGVREAVITASLSPVLSPSTALAVALAARLVFTVGDLIAAASTAPIRIIGADPVPAADTRDARAGA